MPAAPDEEPLTLTRAAHDRLRSELDELTSTGRKQIAERLLRARELGDLRENAEYDAAKDEQGLMEARIRKLEHMLRQARIVETPSGTDEVAPGVLVTVRSPDAADDDPEVYLVASSPEERAKDARTVSVKSPLGQALLGKRVGDKASYQAPGGTFTYEITAIAPWDGAA